MARLMALDVGRKTIGIAFTDESATIVFPGTTLLRHEGRRRDMAALREIVETNGISKIVVGMPLKEDLTPGPQAEAVEQFILHLRNSVRIPIIKQDEAFSTVAAADILDAKGTPRTQHKRTIDSVAACVILQDYLTSSPSSGCSGDGDRGETEQA